MRITRNNVQEFIRISEELTSALDTAKETCETWNDLQDEERTEEIAEEIRNAREEMEEVLDGIDATEICQLLHGKHKGK